MVTTRTGEPVIPEGWAAAVARLLELHAAAAERFCAGLLTAAGPQAEDQQLLATGQPLEQLVRDREDPQVTLQGLAALWECLER